MQKIREHQLRDKTCSSQVTYVEVQHGNMKTDAAKIEGACILDFVRSVHVYVGGKITNKLLIKE